MPANKTKSVDKSNQSLKTTRSRIKKPLNEAATKEKGLVTAEQPVKRSQKKTKKATQPAETSKKKKSVPKAGTSKPIQSKKKRTVRKKKAPTYDKKRGVSILLLGIVIVSIYALFTDDLSILSKTTKGTIIVFLLFVGFNCLLIFLGYKLGIKKNKR
ncbi:hypothetical protein [Ectobacillus panaciterrae]|uniref:hypothetical protein n=1 Tax=Ectobacillus panaciterrae TaxID=363872 RepID=UPI000491863D|nr:hypothetical protein [Ectobacillus panaciterrae]